MRLDGSVLSEKRQSLVQHSFPTRRSSDLSRLTVKFNSKTESARESCCCFKLYHYLRCCWGSVDSNTQCLFFFKLSFLSLSSENFLENFFLLFIHIFYYILLVDLVTFLDSEFPYSKFLISSSHFIFLLNIIFFHFLIS